jgi:hypothetical protein
MKRNYVQQSISGKSVEMNCRIDISCLVKNVCKRDNFYNES